MSAFDELMKKAENLTTDAREIMLRKNHDYTGGSGDPFANFRGSESLDIHPALGILLRMQDKMQRIRTFVERGELKVDGEGLYDAALDIINYTILIYALLTEEDSVQEVSDSDNNEQVNGMYIPWDNAPDWAQWWCCDAIGSSWFTEREPTVYDSLNEWLGKPGIGLGRLQTGPLLGAREDWRELKQARPE